MSARPAAATPYALIAPTALYYALFWAGPVCLAVGGSFLSPAGRPTTANYARVFGDPLFWQAAVNTGIIVVVSVSLEFVLAFALALLINTRFRGSGTFLFLAMIPMALPAVAVGAMWSSGFATAGWLNALLTHLGLLGEGERIAWLATGGVWRLAGIEIAPRPLALIILVDAWQVIPFMMIILLAGMQNLDPSLPEAGYIFGGGRWAVFRRITVPLLKPTIQTALLLRLIAAIQIWLIVVMIYGYNRLPVLLERVVYYQDEKTTAAYHKLAMSTAVLVALLVSVAAVLYLWLSGAGRRRHGA
jgi:multiple sugar transport system permease protein